jgi:protein-S-isoprenylcysteine O-methyltransferase Ste14
MRVIAVLIGRLSVSVAVLALAGGTAALTHPIALAFLAFEAVWSLAEGFLARSELTQTRDARARLAQHALSADARQFLFAGKRYFLANLVYHLVALAEFARRAATTPPRLGVLTLLGLATYALGATLRGWAMAAMGERFRSWTVSRAARGLETAGPYVAVRHPSYLGLMLIGLSLPLIFEQPWMWILSLFPIAAIVGRVEPEERLLRHAYGAEYAAYSSRTRFRLLPGVW